MTLRKGLGDSPGSSYNNHLFVSQVHAAGVEAEVDWGEVHVAMAGVSSRVYMSRRSTGSAGCSGCCAMNMCRDTYS
jgi:hypothetical protein